MGLELSGSTQPPSSGGITSGADGTLPAVTSAGLTRPGSAAAAAPAAAAAAASAPAAAAAAAAAAAPEAAEAAERSTRPSTAGYPPFPSGGLPHGGAISS